MAASTCEKLQYNDLCIYESKACFYLNNLRRWVQGTFYVSPEGLYYECDATQSADTGFNGISIDFNEISLVQKEASSYIFPSLVIYVDKEKYWFSSFPSRESAFNMLEHFWKENLFLSSKKLNRPRKNSIEESALGKELLKIIYDSEKVLNSSAQALQRQGAQLDNAMVAAEKLHGDLTLADSRLSTLESWVGKWSVSPAIGVLQKNIASTKTIFQYPVVYCKLDSSAKERSFQGFLRIEPDMLTVTDEHEIVVHHFKKKDISAIYIISPWELKIEQRKIGTRDVCYSLTTAQLVVALTQLQRHFGSVLEMEEIRTGPRRKIRPKALQPDREIYATFPLITNDDQGVVHVMNQQQVLVSDQEVKELNEMLGAMKGLAVEITREQDQQLHKIDHLIESVDQADIKIKEDVKRIKKLM